MTLVLFLIPALGSDPSLLKLALLKFALFNPFHGIMVLFREHQVDFAFGLSVHDAPKRLMFAPAHASLDSLWPEHPQWGRFLTSRHLGLAAPVAALASRKPTVAKSPAS